MIRRLAAALLLVAFAAVLLVAAWPELFGLQAAPIIAQVVSLRGLDILIAVVVMVVLGVIAVVWRASRRLLLSMVALLLVFSVASVAILAGRGFSATASPQSPTSITVLSWNTKGDAPGAAEIAKLALARHADVITLPETTLITGKAVEGIMAAAGRPMWVLSDAYDYVSKSRSTTLLVSSALGAYKVDRSAGNTRVLPTVIARPDSGNGPTIISVHAVSPIPKQMRNWRADLAWLATQCTGANTIMAGDFNSTLDHLRAYAKPGKDFGSCSDAAFASHGGALGSWPTNLPQLLGAQIDHVMYGSAWKVTAMEVIGTEDGAGSDHRPIVATLTRR
jgi:endonuclease/exonuclease/phosphatase (EEP) superfamily protein YafD